MPCFAPIYLAHALPYSDPLLNSALGAPTPVRGQPIDRGPTESGEANSLFWIRCEHCGQSLRLMVRCQSGFAGLSAGPIGAVVWMSVICLSPRSPLTRPSLRVLAVNGKVTLGGAQQPDAFLEAFGQVVGGK
jgi:hypothetical protein